MRVVVLSREQLRYDRSARSDDRRERISDRRLAVVVVLVTDVPINVTRYPDR